LQNEFTNANQNQCLCAHRIDGVASSRRYYKGWPKNWHTLFCTPYNFVKYWPIFKIISLSEAGGHLQ